MSNELDPKTNPSQPMVYQIRIKGHLGRQWTDWFEGLTITLEEDGDTLLTGPVIDQAALHGLLKKVRDLGMPLVSVSPRRTRPGGSVRCQIVNGYKLPWKGGLPLITFPAHFSPREQGGDHNFIQVQSHAVTGTIQ